MPAVFKASVSPEIAPLVMLPLTVAPVAAVVPSKILVVVPPMEAVAVTGAAVMLAMPRPVDAVVLESV
jgi:hypothetical protein